MLAARSNPNRSRQGLICRPPSRFRSAACVCKRGGACGGRGHAANQPAGLWPPRLLGLGKSSRCWTGAACRLFAPKGVRKCERGMRGQKNERFALGQSPERGRACSNKRRSSAVRWHVSLLEVVVENSMIHFATCDLSIQII